MPQGIVEEQGLALLEHAVGDGAADGDEEQVENSSKSSGSGRCTTSWFAASRSVSRIRYCGDKASTTSALRVTRAERSRAENSRTRMASVCVVRAGAGGPSSIESGNGAFNGMSRSKNLRPAGDVIAPAKFRQKT
jgi:hypothetical protein